MEQTDRTTIKDFLLWIRIMIFSKESSAGDTKTNQADTETQTNHKETETTNVAGKYFDSSDYEGTTQLEKGLAETHEQVSDDYFEGTIDQNLE